MLNSYGSNSYGSRFSLIKVIQAFTLNWDLTTAITKAYTVIWDITNLVTKAYIIRWNVTVLLSVTYTFLWNTFGRWRNFNKPNSSWNHYDK